MAAAIRVLQDLLIAQSLTASSFGRTATALSGAYIGAALGNVGFTDNSMRVLGPAKHAGDAATVRAYWYRGSLASVLLPGLIAGAVFWSVDRPSEVYDVFLAVCMGSISGLIWFQRAVLVGLSRQILGASLFASWPALAATVVVLSNPRSAQDALHVLIVTGLAAVVVGTAVGWIVATEVGDNLERSRTPSSVPLMDQDQRWVYVGSSATFAQGQADFLLVAALLPDATAGMYAAVIRLGLGISLLVQAVGFARGAEYAVSDSVGQYREAYRSFARSARTLGIIAAPLALTLPLVGNQALDIVGSGYSAPISVLVFVALGRWVSAATGPCGVFLVATGQSRSYARIGIVSLALSALLLVPAITIVGVGGAALIAALTVGFRDLSQVRVARRR